MAFLMFPILGENLCSTSSSSATAEQQSCIDHYCYGELPTSSALQVTKIWFGSFSQQNQLSRILEYLRCLPTSRQWQTKMLNIGDELLEICRHQRKLLLALLFEEKKKKPPDTTIKQQGRPKHFSLKILQKPSNLIQI